MRRLALSLGLAMALALLACGPGLSLTLLGILWVLCQLPWRGPTFDLSPQAWFLTLAWLSQALVAR
jgi:hypothetical protein